MNAKIISNLKDNYNHLEESIASQLQVSANHSVTTGHYRERIWHDLFRQITPHKFSIRQGVFLIDSGGNISNEVDLAVFDEQYTPYIFNYGQIYYIPIEAVAVVIECKSQNPDEKELKEWSASIDQLSVNSHATTRVVSGVFVDSHAPAQPNTRPMKFLCSLSPVLEEEKPKHGFDIAISVDKTKRKLHIAFADTLSNLYEAYKALNCRKLTDSEVQNIIGNDSKRKLQEKPIESFEVKGNSILSLTFQLNQLLMLINNPMLFPHQAYVNLFNEVKE